MSIEYKVTPLLLPVTPFNNVGCVLRTISISANSHVIDSSQPVAIHEFCNGAWNAPYRAMRLLEAISVGHVHMVRALSADILGRT